MRPPKVPGEEKNDGKKRNADDPDETTSFLMLAPDPITQEAERRSVTRERTFTIMSDEKRRGSEKAFEKMAGSRIIDKVDDSCEDNQLRVDLSNT